jgi:zinc/manganese transport system permease protein
MIRGFLASWSLFQNSYLAGWSSGVLLSLAGVVVVARDQIFLGAAVSQASMLGIASAMWLGGSALLLSCGWCTSDGFLTLMGGGFAVLGALLAGGMDTRTSTESHEAVTGWVFLLSASLSVLLLSHSPHGLEEVHRLLASTIIGASGPDVWTFAIMIVVTGIVLSSWGDRILLLVMDPEMAGAVGIPVRLWNRTISVWLGVTVGVSIRVTGMIYTFGCLVLPALVARNACREVRAMFLVAPLVALGAGGMGFVLAHHYDYPPGQVTVALLSGALVAAWSWRGARGALGTG